MERVRSQGPPLTGFTLPAMPTTDREYLDTTTGLMYRWLPEPGEWVLQFDTYDEMINTPADPGDMAVVIKDPNYANGMWIKGQATYQWDHL